MGQDLRVVAAAEQQQADGVKVSLPSDMVDSVDSSCVRFQRIEWRCESLFVLSRQQQDDNLVSNKSISLFCVCKQ